MADRPKAHHCPPIVVRSVVSELALSGPLSISRVARRLGISSRSLQRHLCRQGLTCRAIVDQVRLETSRILLSETDLPVQIVAGRVGYRTPGAFARAFLRLAGQSPRSYRRSQRRET